MFIAPARKTAKEGVSSGVLVGVRRHVVLPADHGPYVLEPHRAIAIVVNTRLFGRMLLVSVYMVTGGWVGGECPNARIVERLARALKEWEGTLHGGGGHQR